jgi:hypothetical protein
MNGQTPQLILSVPLLWERIPYHLLEDQDELIRVGRRDWWSVSSTTNSVPESFIKTLFQCCRPLLEFQGERHEFVIEIGGRGLNGSRQNLCLRNIRFMGSDAVLADHVWVQKTNVWNLVEPLIQGRRLMVDATVTVYRRTEPREIKQGGFDMSIICDAGLEIHRVFELGRAKLSIRGATTLTQLTER